MSSERLGARSKLDRSQCAAVITAAGASSRMGTAKALVDWQGQPLLVRQLAAVRGFAQRIVVLGAAADEIRAARFIPADVTVVENEAWEKGRSGSLRRGCSAVGAGILAVLVSGVDQPIDPVAIDALLAAFDPSRHAFAVPVVGPRRGHPLLVSGTLLPALRELADGETMRDVMAQHDGAGLEVPVQTRLPLLDFNRPEDLGWDTMGP